MTPHPVDLEDAVERAARAANRARVLPFGWVGLPVELYGRWYVVILGRPPYYRIAAVYSIRPDSRLRRIVRWPAGLPDHAFALLRTNPTRRVEYPGLREGWVMTTARE